MLLLHQGALIDLFVTVKRQSTLTKMRKGFWHMLGIEFECPELTSHVVEDLLVAWQVCLQRQNSAERQLLGQGPFLSTLDAAAVW